MRVLRFYLWRFLQWGRRHGVVPGGADQAKEEWK